MQVFPNRVALFASLVALTPCTAAIAQERTSPLPPSVMREIPPPTYPVTKLSQEPDAAVLPSNARETAPKVSSVSPAEPRNASTVANDTTKPAIAQPPQRIVHVEIVKEAPARSLANTDTPEKAPEKTPDRANRDSASSTAPTSIPPSVRGHSLGLDPAQPLVVPTTPSQVKLDRLKPVTLAEILELANRSNRDIINARIAVDKARAALQEAEAAKYPTVSAEVDYTFNDSASSRLSSIASPSGTTPRGTISQPLQGTLGVSYNIFNSGAVDASVHVALNALRRAEADLNRVTQVSRLTIATAYYNLQGADENLRIRKKQVENAERSLKDTQAQERAGVGTKFDVLQAEVALANAQQDLLNATASQLVARRTLAQRLDYPSNLEITTAENIQPVQDWKLSLEDSILLAVRNRAELDIRKLEREIARDRAVAAAASLSPQVTLFANGIAADDLSVVGGFALGYQLGARVQWNLFDGGKAQAQVNQFKADQALAENQFEQDVRQVRFDVEQAYINLQSQRQQIVTATKAVQQATEALRLARLRFNAGVGTQLEVLNAETAATQADVNRLQAIVGFNTSIVHLERAINGL